MWVLRAVCASQTPQSPDGLVSRLVVNYICSNVYDSSGVRDVMWNAIHTCTAYERSLLKQLSTRQTTCIAFKGILLFALDTHHSLAHRVEPQSLRCSSKGCWRD